MKQHLFAPPAIPPSLLVVVVVVVVDVGAGRPPECHSAVSGVPCRSCVPECCVGGAAGWRAVCRSAVPRPPCHTCHTVPCRATPAVPHSAGVPCRARRATRATRPCRAVPAAPEASKYDRPVALPRPRSAPEALTELQVASKPPSTLSPNLLSTFPQTRSFGVLRHSSAFLGTLRHPSALLGSPRHS